MNIIGKGFTPNAFAQYAANVIPQSAWKGQFPVLHNMAPPTLAMRPQGLSAQNMQNLASFYAGKSWHAGPHLFIDDQLIWVFSPLTHPGVHSPAWNPISYGIEQLGDYDTDDYNAGRGLAVQQNAVAAIAVLCHYAGMDTSSLRLHKEDPQTTHKSCPGASCASRKAEIIGAAHDYIVAHLA